MATILRPNQEFTTKATVSKGDTQLVSWIIFNGHNSDAANIFQIQPKIGLELDYSFSQEGKYRIAAYQKEIKTKDDYQSSTELKLIDVAVSYNLLDGSRLTPKNPENFLAGDSLRKGFPAVFEAEFLIKPPTADELSRLQFRLEDAAGNKINEGSAVANVFTFTPRNSNAKYKIIAEYTNEAGVVSKQTFSGTSKALSIKDITHGAQLVRPGRALSFSVTKTQFQFPISNVTNLPESGEIKWNLDKALIGTGKTITIPGNLLRQKKKYHIEAYVTSALGKTGGDNKDSAHNDWHFEVKENIVEKIKITKKPKAGLIGNFEIEEMTFKEYDPAKDGAISWKLTGPETGGGSGKTFSKLFKIAGKYTLSCTMGERQCKEPLKITIVAPIINVDKCKWIDQDNGSGNIITEAGKDQEVCVFVNGDGLDNENLTLNVYDDDTFGKTPVYSITFNTIDAHKTGFYHAFTITKDVISKIKDSGVADYGDLYFNIVRNNVDLQIKNGDQKLGEFLKVTLNPKIINAYFCDANDTQQILISALNGALYFKIYAINMVDKKVEINFLTESDAYWTWKDELELDDYNEIKSKFSDERMIDTKTAKFNNKGEVLVPVNLSKIGKPKNFIRLNAIVKIIEEKKEGAAQKKEQGFYMIHKDLTLLYPPATLPKMAENKGAVMVGREKISGGENKSDDKCPRCEDEITFEQVKQIFPAAARNSSLAKLLIKELNEIRLEYKINTCQRKAHLITQMGSETEFRTLLEEIGDYSVSTLKNLFGYFSRHPREAELFKGNIYELSIRAYGLRKVDRESDIISCAISNNKNTCNDLGNETKEEGYKYIGRGLIQLTGKYNYTNINKEFQKAFPGKGNLISNPELLEKPKYAVMSGLSYWINSDLNSKADYGTSDDVVNSITKIINRKLDDSHYAKRRNSFKKAIEAFRLNECTPAENSTSDGKWHDPVDNPRCTLHMQSGGGGEFGKHWGLFGKTRDGSEHHGLDLFATPGTQIFSCVKCEVYDIKTDGNVPAGYGKQLFLKVLDKETFITHFKEYVKLYPEFEYDKIGAFSKDNDIVLHYAHLRKIYVKKGWIISNVDVPIGETGVSGVTKAKKSDGTAAPHLHFEIRNKDTKNRINPGFFLDFKNFKTMSEVEKNQQKNIAEKGKIYEFQGQTDIYKNEADYEKK